MMDFQGAYNKVHTSFLQDVATPNYIFLYPGGVALRINIIYAATVILQILRVNITGISFMVDSLTILLSYIN